MRCTGLKKCIPQKRSGRSSAAAISSTESEEVFVARTQRSGTRASVSFSTACFTSIFSTIASTTRSAAASPWYVSPPAIRSMPCAASRLESLRRFTPLSKRSRA